MEELARLYINDIVRLQGVPSSIVSDCDPRFTSRFWEAFQRAFGMRLSQHGISSTNGWTVRTDYLDIGGYAKGVCLGSTEKLGPLYAIGGVCVTPTTGIGMAIKTKKLNLRYIGPFDILRRFGPMAYQVALPPHLSNLHDVFHVSQLCKYTSDAAHVLEPELVELKENLTFQVAPMRIDHISVKKLRGKKVQLVKVAWKRA
ncbi:uncharacterized protein LOC107646830 [Arachis ipaensis]|uniref:uncharacterized protein LOC107646830 n=1 Tax=Arachis ipaensis TaxID=130454 RepID=UPI0007AEF2C2|nr:uncharacterized protein LOC107646830 [Arachis ipaensis]XP_025661382.1 uncharacterized protein LOC112756996 [Arachis hypogaea]